MKTVRLREDVYERIWSQKRDGETVSEAIDRLIGSPSLLELEGTLSDDAADEAREAIAESREIDQKATRELYRDTEQT